MRDLYEVVDLEAMGDVVVDGVPHHPWAEEAIDKMIDAGVLRKVKLKESTDVELVVTWTHGRVQRHKKRDVKIALEDAAKYDDDRLGRTARVRSRTVLTSRWEWENDNDSR